MDVMFSAEPRIDAVLGGLYPRIRRYVGGLLRDPVDADDATQETFPRAYRECGSLRDPEAVAPWLYRIATRVCLDRLRERARRRRRESTADSDFEFGPDQEPSAELVIEQDEMSSCVQTYVEDMRDNYRAVLLLHDVHGLSCPEIAALLGDSPGAVKIRLHRARGRLRDALRSGCAFSYDERGALVCEPKS
jgi:RNA polymerase sigma-70 factor (ECF subfamily)